MSTATQEQSMAGDELTPGVITLGKIFGHLATVTSHKRMVARHCFAVGLYRQGLLHDMSKFSPAELINGFRYYQGGKRSPNNGEREEKGYSEAWMHHKGRNKHHYEYWTDYATDPRTAEFPIVYIKMPRKYVAEMLCDRIAASKTYLKDKYSSDEPLKYLLNGKGRTLMHPDTAAELEHMLRILAEQGEDECFRYVREEYLKR